MQMKQKIRKIIMAIILTILIMLGIFYWIDLDRMDKNEPVLFSTWGRKYEPLVEKSFSTVADVSTNINMVLSLEDKIADNTAWCGTFNLIWNDLKNDLVKQDIEFMPQLDIVRNLNKGTFHASYLSEDSYYKTYGVPSLELKEKIEREIQEKFNETSKILDDFNWEQHNSEDYFLYAMLKKKFEFPKEFTELEDGKFGNYENVKYFGINETTDEQVREQVQVLYYNSKEDFAIKLLTQSNDEIIISKGSQQDTFLTMYQEIMQKSKEFKGTQGFSKTDTLKIPNIAIHLKEEITELENKPFLFSNGDSYYIEKALQTIEFELNKKGGEIKSEAGMMVLKNALTIEEKPREFWVDDTFTIFLNEKGKEIPYFAAKISDITKIQENAKKVSNNQNAEQKELYFYGKVLESELNYVIVEPNEGEDIRKYTDKVTINLEENNDFLYLEGAKLKITYTGFIRETYPPRIDAINIELQS